MLYSNHGRIYHIFLFVSLNVTNYGSSYIFCVSTAHKNIRSYYYRTFRAVNVMDGSSGFSSLVWRALDRPVAQQAACTRVLLLTSESYKGESRCLYRYEL